jgi:hypothetical protein
VSTITQRSFAAGEISPSNYAHVDFVKYATGLRSCRNFTVMRHGGAQNRPGFKWVCEVKDSSKQVRLIPFVFNADQTYILEFGDQYMRVIQDGALLTLTSQNINGITNANPCVVTYVGSDTYANGDEIYISGIVGAIGNYLNGRYFKVANVNAGANTFELQYKDGTNVNSTSFGSYTSGGTVAEVYEITTPYQEADLNDIQFVQSADIITLVHPSYAPRELSRTGNTSWTLSTISFGPTIARPAVTSVTGSAGSTIYRYRVTAIDADTGEESYASYTSALKTITGATQANPVVITANSHGFTTGDEIYIEGVGGMTQLNGRTFYVTTLTANTFSLQGEDGTGYTAYTSGGDARLLAFRHLGAATLSSSVSNTINFLTASGAKEYNVYKALNGIYGFIGVAFKEDSATAGAFVDTGYPPDTTDTPPFEREIFNGANEYPSAVGYYQQRRVFANTNEETETVYMSRSGLPKNFTVSSPSQDDDAVTFTLTGRQVNEVRHVVDAGAMIALTSGGEHAIEGDASGVVKPSAVNNKQYGYNGSATLPPIVVGGTVIYVQARGSLVRDLDFSYEADGYRGNELTIFSSHLVDGYTVQDWSFQQIPQSVVWMVRDDGSMLGLTYLKEQQLIGWHRHDTDGTIERVCSVPEGQEDTPYVVVKRTINGTTKRYIERMVQRRIEDIEDAIFMDAAITYDGRNTNNSHTMTLSGGTNWTYDETLTLTSSTGYFSSSYVGKQIHLTGSDGTLIRFTINAYTSGTVVTGKANKTVPVSMRSVAISNWALATATLNGLWHLEGETVSVFGDAYVVASPNNETYDTVTVTNGAVTLSDAYAVIHVGLPYTSDIETLNIDTPQGETVSDKLMIVQKVSMFVEKTRGGFVGPEPPSDDTVDPLQGLAEIEPGAEANFDDPPPLRTEVVEQDLSSSWNSNGRVFIRQVDPLPMTILSIMPSGRFPFRG